MNSDEAKQVLLLYRPGTPDVDDPQVAAAMDVAREDPELAAWFQQHVQFQKSMRTNLREIPVPGHLKTALLVRKRSLDQRPWWVRPQSIWLSSAAAVALLALAFLVQLPHGTMSTEFASFQERIVSEVQRQYAMDWETSDMTRLRASIAAQGGRSDYEVPKNVEKFKLTGGGVLQWQDTPVSMVCFDRGGGQMLFLFVIKRDAVKDPPAPNRPKLNVVHEWATASWSQGENTYLLTGKEAEGLDAFAKKYL